MNNFLVRNDSWLPSFQAHHSFIVGPNHWFLWWQFSIKSLTEFVHLAGALIMEYFIAGPQLMYVLRKIFLKWNKRLDPLYYYLIEPVVTRLFDHSKLSQSKLGNPSSFSRSQTELGSILQMNKTKRNEGREKKLKFKSQYKNTFIFDWQNEKKVFLIWVMVWI